MSGLSVSTVKCFFFWSIFQSSSESHKIGGKWDIFSDRVLPSGYKGEGKGGWGLWWNRVKQWINKFKLRKERNDEVNETMKKVIG